MKKSILSLIKEYEEKLHKELFLTEAPLNVTVRKLGPYTDYWVYDLGNGKYGKSMKDDRIFNPAHKDHPIVRRDGGEFIHGFDKDGYVVTNVNLGDKRLANQVFDYHNALLQNKSSISTIISQKGYDNLCKAYAYDKDCWFLSPEERAEIIAREYDGDMERAKQAGKEFEKAYGFSLKPKDAKRITSIIDQQHRTLNVPVKISQFSTTDLKGIIRDYNIPRSKLNDDEYLKDVALKIYQIPIVKKFLQKKQLGVSEVFDLIKKHLR